MLWAGPPRLWRLALASTLLTRVSGAGMCGERDGATPGGVGGGGRPGRMPGRQYLACLLCARTAEFFETTAARAHSSSRAQARPFQL